jgi:hypothetical protein
VVTTWKMGLFVALSRFAPAATRVDCAGLSGWADLATDPTNRLGNTLWSATQMPVSAGAGWLHQR